MHHARALTGIPGQLIYSTTGKEMSLRNKVDKCFRHESLIKPFTCLTFQLQLKAQTINIILSDTPQMPIDLLNISKLVFISIFQHQNISYLLCRIVQFFLCVMSKFVVQHVGRRYGARWHSCSCVPNN